jgi:cation diffusion facilitator CzcD-associated flavoprotein CzcO
MDCETLDIVVVGGGLSGINAGYRLQTQVPHLSYAILESRDEIGGTWAFWKYPGIRTDSSMGLFGFPWRPWPHDSNMAAGPEIKKYLQDCAAAEGIDKKIRFRHRLAASTWSSAEQRWTLRVEATREDGTVETKVIKAWWVISASGYYRYDKPLEVTIPGIEKFGGEVVHPQFWNDSVSCEGKKVIIIGSGATAVTLLPALAETAASVTMLQRSPSYVFSLPPRQGMVDFLARWMPLSWARQLHWWQRMLTETMFVMFLMSFPNVGRRYVVGEMKKQLPEHVSVEKHFNPWYNPFEQRLCFCPGGDFFKALHRPNVHIATDIIETVTATGIRLKSGAHIDADMIITATGLHMALLDGVSVTVDGESVTDSLNSRYIWNGTMLEGVPNSGLIIGYTAATWTPGADVRTRQLIKVIRYMDQRGMTAGVPYIEPAERATLPTLPAVGLNSTYVKSAAHRMPKTGAKAPWVNGAFWASDAWRLLRSNVRDGMKYTFGQKKKDL